MRIYPDADLNRIFYNIFSRTTLFLLAEVLTMPVTLD
jgi:hypothetical protein